MYETRSQVLKRKYQQLQQQQDQNSPHAELFELLKPISAKEAMGIFRRIKTGHDIRAILGHVRDGNLLHHLHLMPEIRLRHKLPYIPHMPGFLGQGNYNPYLVSLVYIFTWPDHFLANHHQQAVPRQDFSPYLKPYHAAMLVEPVLYDIKISA